VALQVQIHIINISKMLAWAHLILLNNISNINNNNINKRTPTFRAIPNQIRKASISSAEIPQISLESLMGTKPRLLDRKAATANRITMVR